MSAFNFTLWILALCLLEFTAALSFTNCGPEDAELLKLDVSPCDREHCILQRGSRVTVSIKFRALTNIDAGGHKIEQGERILVLLPQNGLCIHVTPTCPIKKAGEYIYSYTGRVPDNAEIGLVVVRWKLLYTDGRMFICAEFPLEII